VHRSVAEFMEQHEQHVAGIELDELLALLLRQVSYARMLGYELRVVPYAEPEPARPATTTSGDMIATIHTWMTAV
jgi:hypothetical protein